MSDAFNIPCKTLEGRLKITNANIGTTSPDSMLRKENEERLIKYLKRIQTQLLVSHLLAPFSDVTTAKTDRKHTKQIVMVLI